MTIFNISWTDLPTQVKHTLITTNAIHTRTARLKTMSQFSATLILEGNIFSFPSEAHYAMFLLRFG
jgi:hypothetical protein